MSTPMHIPKGKIVLTYEDYVLLPDDRNRYEILEGELTVTPAPSTKHQSASANLFKLLSRHIDDRNLGKLFYAPVDLILDPTTILQPDLLFVFSAHQQIITERAIEGVPDLVVEILSPTTSRTEESVEIYRLEGDVFRLEVTLQGATPTIAPPIQRICDRRERRISLSAATIAASFRSLDSSVFNRYRLT